MEKRMMGKEYLTEKETYCQEKHRNKNNLNVKTEMCTQLEKRIILSKV